MRQKIKYKNIFLAACPGTASNSLKLCLENAIGVKAISLKFGGGFHQTSIRKPNLSKKILFLQRKIFKEQNLFYQHFFPTKQNMTLLNKYIGKDTLFLVTYRNIFEIANYITKWNFYKNRGPLSMIYSEDRSKNYYDTDLNIILILQFYKLWFANKKNKKFNIKFINYKHIVNKDINLINSLKKITTNKFNLNFSKNVSSTNKKFRILKFRKNLIFNFKKNNPEVNFNLIGL